MQSKRRSKRGAKKNAVSLLRRATLNNFQFTSVVRATVGDSNTTTASVGVSFFLNYPTYYRNIAGTIVQMTNVAALLANEQKVFDEYKVITLTLKYMPYLTNNVPLSSYTTAAGNTGVTQIAPPWDPSIIVGQDNDDSAVLTTVAKALSNQGINYRSRVGNDVRTLWVMKQVDPIEQMKWCNLGAIIPNVSSPPDPNNPIKLASIKCWTGIGPAAAYPLANTTIGVYVAEWMVKFKGVYTLG